MAVPDAEIDDFVEVINTDSALAARIVRIADSTFFGYVRKATSVKQAITLIGVLQLHDLLLSSLAIRAFSGIPTDVINQDAFWRSCIYSGITARMLAKECMLPASERLFTSGLLHEIGHIVMYAKIPEQVQDVLIESQQSNKPLFMLEREKLGFDYGQVGSELMRLWHLPESYRDIAAFHMEPEKAQNYKNEIAIINLARCMMLAEERDPESPEDSFSKKSSVFLKKNLSQESVENIKINARLYVDEVMNCLWPFARKTRQDSVLIL